MSETAPSGSIKAGGAYVELFTVDSKFHKGLASAQQSLRQFSAAALKAGAALSAASGAIVAGLLANAKAFADAGGALNDMSQRTGIAVESLSALKYAAGMSGSSIQTLETGLKSMQKALYAADEESKSAQETLTSLGVSIGDLTSLTPDKQFEKIAGAIARVSDPTRRAALAMKIFGGAGQELIPLLSGGAEGIRQLTKEAQELGHVMSTDDAKSAAKLGDELNKLQASFDTLKNTVGAAVAGELTGFLKYLNEASPAVLKAIGENKEWILWLGHMSAKMGAVGIAMGSLGTAAYALSTAITVLRTATIGLTASLGLIGGLGVAAAVAIITKEIWDQVTMQSQLNKELERSIDLREKLAQVGTGQTQKTIEESRGHGGDDRHAFLQQSIKTELKNLDQKEKRVAKLQAEIESLESQAQEREDFANHPHRKHDSGPEREQHARFKASSLRQQANAIRTGDLADEQSILNTTNERLKALQTELEDFKVEQSSMDRSVDRRSLGMSHSNLTYDESNQAEADKFNFSMTDALSEASAKQKQEAARIKQSLEKEAESLAESLLSPHEKLQKRMEHLQKLKDHGLPDWAYDKAALEARREEQMSNIRGGIAAAESSLNKQTNAAALQKGSAEAFSAMVQAMQGRQSTEEQIQKNTKDSAKDLKFLAREAKTNKDRITIRELNMA